MPYEILNRILPGLSDALKQQTKPDVWAMLKRLLEANAPSGGANLLGGIGDDIAVLADQLGLRERVIPQLGATGNTAIWLGADKAAADVIVVAHMDRPSFRVKAVADGSLFPICAIRFPADEYRVAAKALRFERGRRVVGAQGLIAYHKGDNTLRFEASKGQLAWQDTVVMDVTPVCDGDVVIGTGLDNSLGMLMALLAAAALRQDEAELKARRCLFVFTDQEEGPPEAFFGPGAARLMHAVPPPTYGCVVVDAQTAGPGLVPQMGAGVSYSAASGWGRGAIVPPNYHALAIDLADGLNKARPGTVQINTGHLSRSDDMILGQWTRILALSGPPMTDPHTGQETAHLSDIQSGAWWLAYLTAAVLNITPDLTPPYALGR